MLADMQHYTVHYKTATGAIKSNVFQWLLTLNVPIM